MAISDSRIKKEVVKDQSRADQRNTMPWQPHADSIIVPLDQKTLCRQVLYSTWYSLTLALNNVAIKKT